jgi:sugar-specific transcriptional regulator TrmB
LSEEPVRSILKGIGLSEKEAEIYIFLAKNAALRSGEIAKLTKMDKAEVYRVLTNLQTKGLVEKTLEAPTRFTSTPFEKTIDSFIKYKRDEATLVEKTKNELIKDWNNITKCWLEVIS